LLNCPFTLKQLYPPVILNFRHQAKISFVLSEITENSICISMVVHPEAQIVETICMHGVSIVVVGSGTWSVPSLSPRVTREAPRRSPPGTAVPTPSPVVWWWWSSGIYVKRGTTCHCPGPHARDTATQVMLAQAEEARATSTPSVAGGTHRRWCTS
jgi:hypothetical protein